MLPTPKGCTRENFDFALAHKADPAQVTATVTANNLTCYGFSNGKIIISNPTGATPFQV